MKICRTISWLGDCSLSPTTPKNVMFNNLMQFNTKPSQHKWKGTFDIMDNHNKNIDASNSVTWYQITLLDVFIYNLIIFWCKYMRYLGLFISYSFIQHHNNPIYILCTNYFYSYASTYDIFPMNGVIMCALWLNVIFP